MGSPRLTEMNRGLRRLTRTHCSPLFSSVFPFDAPELGGSQPKAPSHHRRRHPELHGDKYGEESQQQRQQQGPASFKLHWSDTGRI